MASCEIQSGEHKIAGGTLTVTKLPAGRARLKIQIEGAPVTDLILNENGYPMEDKPTIAIKPAPATAGSAASVTFEAGDTVKVAEADETSSVEPAPWKRRNR